VHEIERHRVILGEVADRPVVTVVQLCELTGASEATIRRDIGALHVAGRLRRVRGGVEALHPPQTVGIAGRPFSVNETVNRDKKQAIARAAVDLCEDGESIIINGGTTTYEMVHHLARRRMQILTNSFPIAERLLKNSKNTIICARRRHLPRAEHHPVALRQ
jgi:DeoR family ulaG and ulaABCDEF operon transcriptional repressor